MSRKQTLRAFTRELPSREDHEHFRQAMNSPSELVTAVIQVIELDYLLEQSIIAKLARQDEATIELLCKGNGPLASFCSKITLGYAMDLFDDEAMACLNTVRRIRNAFAHSRKGVSFATPVIRAELAAVKLPKNQKSEFYKAVDLARRLTSPEATTEPALLGRAAYVLLCMTLVAFFYGSKRQRPDSGSRASKAGSVKCQLVTAELTTRASALPHHFAASEISVAALPR